MSSLVSLIAPRQIQEIIAETHKGRQGEHCTHIIFVFLLFSCAALYSRSSSIFLSTVFLLGLVFAEFLQFFLLIRHEVRGIRTGEQRRGSFSCE